MIRRTLLTLLLLAPLALVGAVLCGLVRIPPEWDPRAPLDFRAVPNLMTQWKLARMALQPEACFDAFAASGIEPQGCRTALRRTAVPWWIPCACRGKARC
jgi:hypothetical protein